MDLSDLHLINKSEKRKKLTFKDKFYHFFYFKMMTPFLFGMMYGVGAITAHYVLGTKYFKKLQYNVKNMK